MRQLLFSPAALNDLSGIYDYTFETWGIAQAEHYVRELNEVCVKLASGDSHGRASSFIRPGYFKKLVGSHIIFYRRQNPDTMQVVRILHQKMNIEAHLN